MQHPANHKSLPAPRIGRVPSKLMIIWEFLAGPRLGPPCILAKSPCISRNCRERRVRSGLRPQPASPVSRIGFRIFWKPPTLPGFSRCTNRLSSTARRKFRSRVPNSRESLRSETCHIRIFTMETWFELSETGSKLDLSARNVSSLLGPRPAHVLG